MSPVHNLIARVKTRLGDLWWYTLLLFCVGRASDVISAVIGLYLVPKYVSQDELGAVLPLAQIGTVLGLPMTILLIPFTKFLNTYATRGEYGKVKRLLRDAFILAAIMLFGTLLYAHHIMPLLFERMRVQNGHLGLLIVASGVVATLSPVFGNALQALKKFKLLAVLSFGGAIVRLGIMLITLPIRGLSGYFLSQTSASVFGIAAALLGLRRWLGREVKMEPYWDVDWKPLLKYTLPVAVTFVAVSIQAAAETFVIRQRLPAVESAGYYIISRFGEIGSYLGMTLLFVLFPLVSEKHERGATSFRLLWQSMAAALGSGLLLAAFLLAFGGRILNMNPAWRAYSAYAPCMALLAAVYALRTAGGCFAYHQMACNRFGFVWYCSLASVLEAVILCCLTGYDFFAPYFPTACVAWMASWQAARLSFVLATMFVFSCLPFLGILMELSSMRITGRTLNGKLV